MTGAAADTSIHRKLAGELFNSVWALLDQFQRTTEEDELMLHAAHASRYHWSIAGTAREWSVGEWQISRVYAVLKRSEPAIHHGTRAMELARDQNLGSFYLAYGYEAMARAYSIAGDMENARLNLSRARELSHAIPEDENRRMLADDLASIILRAGPVAG